MRDCGGIASAVETEEGARMKIDLHVHTCHSRRPAVWLLQKLGCPESFTDPVACYHALLRLGMNRVTFTDHNSIEGCLAVAHLPGTFISEEVTAYFPEDRCKVHVLAYDITEEAHCEIQRLRENLYDLVAFLRARRIPHAIAHAYSAVNDKFTRSHFEKLLLLFNTFEINGDQVREVNEHLRLVLGTLTPQEIALLADRHAIMPQGETPWRKALLCGSDDHAGTGFGASFTRVSGAEDLDKFFAGVQEGRATISAGCATGRSFARDIYSVAYRFVKGRFGLDKYTGLDVMLRFCDATLLPGQPRNYGMLAALGYALGNLRNRKTPGIEDSLTGYIRSEAVRLIRENPELRGVLSAAAGERDDGAMWYDFVDRVSNRTLAALAESFVRRLTSGEIFDLFHLLGSAGTLGLMLAPYFVSYPFYAAERRLARNITREMRPAALPAEGVRVGCFTDTFHECNGVAATLRQQLECALMTGRDLRMLTCRSGYEGHPGLRNFAPVYTCELPDQKGGQLNFPPLLQLLDYCFDADFTCLQAATPGPVGLSALLVGRILGIPVFSTYHTGLAEYVQAVTEDRSLSDLAWRYMVWFFNQTALVQVSSRHAFEVLAARGVSREKLCLCPRGVDCQLFSPRQYRAEVRAHYLAPAGVANERGLPEAARSGDGGGPLILYAGRLARERGLDLLLSVCECLFAEFPQARLVFSGEGEYGAVLRRRAEATPALKDRVTFTGGLPEQELAELYAASDVLVFPQAAEASGVGVLEAQASGLPVVVSDDGGLQERMRDGVTGYVFRAGDAAGLDAALRRVLRQSSQERRQMGAQARTFAEDYDYTRAFTEHWEQIVELIAAQTVTQTAESDEEQPAQRAQTAGAAGGAWGGALWRKAGGSTLETLAAGR